MTRSFEFGIDTFGDVTLDASGAPVSQAQSLRHVVEEAVAAAIAIVERALGRG